MLGRSGRARRQAIRANAIDRQSAFLRAIRDVDGPLPASRARGPRTESQREPSVYLLRHPWEHWVKVGVAVDIKRRMGTYVHAWGVQPPIPPIVIDPSSIRILRLDAYGLERAILDRFERVAARTEWLRLTADTLEFEAACPDPSKMAALLNLDIPGLAVA